MQLPDINFWLALAFQSHEHHASAKAWMQSAADQSCCFCRRCHSRRKTCGRKIHGRKMNRRKTSIRVLYFSAPHFSARPDFSNQTPENLREKTRIQLLAVRDCYFHPSLGVAKPQIRNPNLEIRKNYGRKDASQKPSAALQAATKSLCATGDASTSISSLSLLTRLRSILRTWAERWGQNDQKRLTLWFIVLPS